MERGENSPVVGHIETIPRGIYGGGHSKNSGKKYAIREVYGVMSMEGSTEAITFTDMDGQGLEMPHEDSLVISPKIAHFTMERILLNTGSSTDIRY
ncbi:hypothetical protein LIER_05777 [Lithospermum erythrorhizon]|uniref:Uncharacterized protein n=1 Tax=Lithospermum erythrorhizon TaxID=34254 RepID=A0AAV3P2C7_LITER